MKHVDDTTFEVNEHDFAEKVVAASAGKLILVDFWAEWCSPCLVLAPVLERVLAEYEGAVKLAKLEVDEGDNMRLAGHYKVRGFPTVIAFRDGEALERFTGAQPAHVIRDFIDRQAAA